jgi:hypothetical protein
LTPPRNRTIMPAEVPMKHSLLLFAILTSLFALPALAQTPPSPIAELAVPPDVLTYRLVGTLLVGTTRSGKLVTYDIANRAAPVRKAETDAGVAVAELRVVDGMLLAVGVDDSIRAFRFGENGALVALQWGGQPKSGTPKSGTLGHVVETKRGNLLVELDPGAGVVPGDILLVRSRGMELKLNPFTGQDEEIASNAPTAVVEVIRVEGNRAVAELNRGDIAVSGDTVELNDHRREVSRAFPARSHYTQWVRATVRPMANIGAVDIASLTDLAWGYYRSWFHVQARIAPVGISVPHGVDILNAHAIFAYSSDLAEFGLGVGYYRESWGNNSSFYNSCDTSAGITSKADDSQPIGNGVSTQLVVCTKSGPSFVQHLRLGGVDGLNLRITNTTVISDGFRFGYFDGVLDIPLNRTLNLYGMGGGSTTVGIGEFGVRTYLRGVGGHETFVLTTGVGYTAMMTSSMYNTTVQNINGLNASSIVGGTNVLHGPHFALGLEYRL